MKICKCCDLPKPLTEFWKHADTKDGLRPQCKTCIRGQSATHYQSNKTDYRIRDKLWRQQNPEAAKNIMRRHTNSPKRKKTLSIWKRKNKTKLTLYFRAYMRNHLKNPINRLNSNMARRMRYSLKSNKNNVHWERLVEYSILDLKIHLEKLFQHGMSWDNYGKWHIDHIKPVASFKITGLSCPEFKKCWALENLQPLWAKDNCSKSDRII